MKKLYDIGYPCASTFLQKEIFKEKDLIKMLNFFGKIFTKIISILRKNYKKDLYFSKNLEKNNNFFLRRYY